MARAAKSSAPLISVVVPVFDEEGAAPGLAREIAAAFEGRNHEIIFVDDASRDGTRAALGALKTEIPPTARPGASQELRPEPLGPHRDSGPRGEVIVTLDGDGQNDPADGPKLVDALLAGPPDLALVGGERVKRQDSHAKKWASRVGNGVRKRLLKDTANDTGCGLKAFRRDAFLRLPYFDHIHRYLPALMLREGYQTAFLPVHHRNRETGVSKYTNLGRLWVSLSDLYGVMWLQSRSRLPGQVDEI
ncbi:glycosyltransferase family 2 protein [Phenylobacterium sp. J367]|uniref:glycosyltransferase family 2 protein n=1 Tax=Phenylobacterium sp. J367 TaxID=2898435 RepID=UPI002151B75C|nr:glycosyltransferase family 2 protein [Phenylobacterium sp. J367]MCR5877660.1 glycosyltransferase family 2 protein [Phenylobacterium sp. J367]